MGQFIEEQENLDRYYYTNKQTRFPKETIYAITLQYLSSKNTKNANELEVFEHIRKTLGLEKINVSALKRIMGNNRFINYDFVFDQYKKYKTTPDDVDFNAPIIIQPTQKQENSNIAYYYCTKKIRFPLKDVVKDIYDLFCKYNKPQLDLTTIYEYMSNKYNVSSFNRVNLAELLQSRLNVPFNKVRDLYIQTKEDTTLKETYNFDLLNSVFIKDPKKLKDCLNSLGLEQLQQIISLGINPAIVSLDELIKVDPEQYKNQLNNKTIHINDKDKELIIELLKTFNESEWNELLDSPEQLKEYVGLFVDDKKIELEKASLKNTINNHFEFIHTDNMNASIKYLFPLSIADKLVGEKIIKVKDIKNISLKACIELFPQKNNIINVLKRLQYSLPSYLNEKYSYIIQAVNDDYKPHRLWETYVAILEHRAEGKTLEATGDIFSLTRERVRQLEKRYLLEFNNFYNGQSGNLNNLLRAFVKNKLYITYEDIQELFPFHPQLFKYFLQTIEVENLLYIEEIDKFYFIDEYDWYKELLILSEDMPPQIHLYEKETFTQKALDMLNRNGISISEDECSAILYQDYKQIGTILSKSRINLGERIRYLLKTYYPHPVSISDNQFLDDFRKKYYNTYKDDNLKTNHAIASLISRVGVLADRGSYVLNDKKYMSKELATKIYEYIMESERESFLTNNLFSIFKTELVSEGIKNKYFLQGSFKQHYGDKLYFRRDYVSKTENPSTIYGDIVDFIKNENRIVTYDELKNEFSGITDIVLSFALSQDGIIACRKKYIHAENIHLNNEDITYLKNTTTQFVQDGNIHHTNDLLTYLRYTNHQLVSKLMIDDHFGLYSILEYLFESDFEFKRPFIALPGVVIENQYDRIVEFVNSLDEMPIDSILEFITDNKLHLYSISEFVDGLDNYVFKNEYSIIAIDKTNINKYNTEIVENLILKELGNNEFIFADKLNLVNLYPKEVAWTPWLVYSAINKFGKNLKAIPSDTKFKVKKVMYARPLIIRKDTPVSNINEYLDFLKSQKNMSETEFYKYLREKGLLKIWYKQNLNFSYNSS